MSQRALKKRELLNLHKNHQHQQPLPLDKEISHQIYRKQFQSSTNVQNKSKQRNSNIQRNSIDELKTFPFPLNESTNLQNCRRAFNSTPNLYKTINQFIKKSQLIRSHSDTDINSIPETNRLVNAKSEFHLKSIASTQVSIPQQHHQHQQQFQLINNNQRMDSMTMMRQKTSSSQPSSTVGNQLKLMQSKRLSIHSGLSTNTACSITSSTSDSTQPPTTGFADVENIRIPIVGYEVMEERARFTVYKLRVENPFTNDCWLVLRRYTDFQRLNNKLKSTFPTMAPLTLPRKKLFGDNFSSLFLSNRVQGLQIFINAVMANEMLRSSQIVRDFFCLDEPPAYSESMEECRAIFEAQEETIAHLKMQLRAKDDVILSLQQQLTEETEHNRELSAAIDLSYEKCSNCSKLLDEFLKKKTETNLDK